LALVELTRRLTTPSPVTNGVTSTVIHVPVLVTDPIVAVGEDAAGGALAHVTDASFQVEVVVGWITPPVGEGLTT